MHCFYYTVRHALTSWGYLALLAGLFGESMELPLPGETLLMFSSFLTRKQTHLQMQWVIPVGIFAAVMGDNLGYLQLSSQLSQTVLYKSSGIFTYMALA